MVCNSSPFLLFYNITNNVERIKYMAERIEMLKTIFVKKGNAGAFLPSVVYLQEVNTEDNMEVR